MTIKNLREYLQNRDQESLLDEIFMLYKSFDFVKDYYDSRLQPNVSQNIASKYKKLLEEQFCPKTGFPKLKYSIARKAISDFKKVCANHESVIDLQLTYVEYGVQCTLTYGDIDERFYDSMQSMFEKTLKDMQEYGLLENFRKRCLNILDQTKNMGWGFGDAIQYLYENFFKNIS